MNQCKAPAGRDWELGVPRLLTGYYTSKLMMDATTLLLSNAAAVCCLQMIGLGFRA
jgi:hypothetical protein